MNHDSFNYHRLTEGSNRYEPSYLLNNPGTRHTESGFLQNKNLKYPLMILIFIAAMSGLSHAYCTENTCNQVCIFNLFGYIDCSIQCGADVNCWTRDSFCSTFLASFSGDCMKPDDCCADQYCDTFFVKGCFPNLLAGACRPLNCPTKPTSPSGETYCMHVENHDCKPAVIPSGYKCCSQTSLTIRACGSGTIDSSVLKYIMKDNNNCGDCGRVCPSGYECFNYDCFQSVTPSTTVTTLPQTCQQSCGGATAFRCQASDPGKSCAGSSILNSYYVNPGTFSDCSSTCWCLKQEVCPYGCDAVASPPACKLPTCQQKCSETYGSFFFSQCQDPGILGSVCLDYFTLSTWHSLSGPFLDCTGNCYCNTRQNCQNGCSGGACTGATTTTIGGSTTTSSTSTTIFSGTTTTTRTTTTSTTTTILIPRCEQGYACNKPGDICCAGGKIYRCDRFE